MLDRALADYLGRQTAVWVWLEQSPVARKLRQGDRIPALLIRQRGDTASVDNSTDRARILFIALGRTDMTAGLIQKAVEREFTEAPKYLERCTVTKITKKGRYRGAGLREGAEFYARVTVYEFDYEPL